MHKQKMYGKIGNVRKPTYSTAHQISFNTCMKLQIQKILASPTGNRIGKIWREEYEEYARVLTFISLHEMVNQGYGCVKTNV